MEPSAADADSLVRMLADAAPDTKVLVVVSERYPPSAEIAPFSSIRTFLIAVLPSSPMVRLTSAGAARGLTRRFAAARLQGAFVRGRRRRALHPPPRRRQPLHGPRGAVRAAAALRQGDGLRHGPGARAHARPAADERLAARGRRGGVLRRAVAPDERQQAPAVHVLRQGGERARRHAGVCHLQSSLAS